MKHKTRGNVSSQGKPRVYFTGHPADVKQHFESITSAILKLHNCAVFYDEDPEHHEDGENFLSDLDRMQLIVVAVTGRYVYSGTFAHNTVFRHAMERHIPVLPILEEGGIDVEVTYVLAVQLITRAAEAVLLLTRRKIPAILKMEIRLLGDVYVCFRLSCIPNGRCGLVCSGHLYQSCGRGSVLLRGVPFPFLCLSGHHRLAVQHPHRFRGAHPPGHRAGPRRHGRRPGVLDEALEVCATYVAGQEMWSAHRQCE